ncbi:hypothetical protein [Streptomyces sp. NPDC046759]|uniref:hypothetical protein n=1 Tax=Streptomyces sp. NPDC046759 TaxID=3155019 RepID=UPI0033E99D52
MTEFTGVDEHRQLILDPGVGCQLTVFRTWGEAATRHAVRAGATMAVVIRAAVDPLTAVMEPVTVRMAGTVVMHAVVADGLRVRSQDGPGRGGPAVLRGGRSRGAADGEESASGERHRNACGRDTPHELLHDLPPCTVRHSVPAGGGRPVVLTLAKLRTQT